MSLLLNLPIELQAEVVKLLDPYQFACLVASSDRFRVFDADEPDRRELIERYPGLWKLACLLFSNAKLKKKQDNFLKKLSSKRISFKTLSESDIDSLLSDPLDGATKRQALYGTAQSISANIELLPPVGYSVDEVVRLHSVGESRSVVVEEVKYDETRKIAIVSHETRSPYECVKRIVESIESLITRREIGFVNFELVEHPNKAIVFSERHIYESTKGTMSAMLNCKMSHGPRGRLFQRFPGVGELEFPWYKGIPVRVAVPENRDMVRTATREILAIATGR